ncbi:MAG: winged helix-turn-helix domain-containing protein [Candidatus Thermoplasmatota archaeon]
MNVASGEIAVTVRALHALTSSGRMDVLRCLRARRMTAAEVAHRAGMRKSSAHKHLTRLASAGFVHRHDDDRVWVYYSLTLHGRHLVESERPRLVLLFASSTLLLMATLVALAWEARLWAKRMEDAWDVGHIGPKPPMPSFWTTETIALVIVTTALGLAVAVVGMRLARAGRSKK